MSVAKVDPLLPRNSSRWGETVFKSAPTSTGFYRTHPGACLLYTSYLIEIQLPRIADAGPAELYIEAEGQQSNRVRLYVEQ